MFDLFWMFNTLFVLWRGRRQSTWSFPTEAKREPKRKASFLPVNFFVISIHFCNRRESIQSLIGDAARRGSQYSLGSPRSNKSHAHSLPFALYRFHSFSYSPSISRAQVQRTQGVRDVEGNEPNKGWVPGQRGKLERSEVKGHGERARELCVSARARQGF